MIFDIIVFLIINVIGFKIVGTWFLVVEFVLFFIFLIWLWIKKYRPVIDRVNIFTGAPGTGKSKLMVDISVNRFRSIRRSVKIRNFFRNIFNKIRKKKVPLEEIPLFLSNFPIKLSRKEMSRKLSEDVVLVFRRLPYKSVVVIDEFSELANNQDYFNVYAKYNIDEFVRMYRQYTKGGFLFLADQSSDSVLVQVRRRIGKVYNLMSFRKIPLLNIGITNIRHLSISEDIKVIEEGQAESIKKNTSWIPLFFYINRYDTYAFSGRVKDMEVVEAEEWKEMKTNKLLTIPVKKIKDKTYIDTKTKKDD